jgi:hypothetical protein
MDVRRWLDQNGMPQASVGNSKMIWFDSEDDAALFHLAFVTGMEL